MACQFRVFLVQMKWCKVVSNIIEGYSKVMYSVTENTGLLRVVKYKRSAENDNPPAGKNRANQAENCGSQYCRGNRVRGR